MKEIVICVSLEIKDSFEDPILKLVRFREGVSYEGFLNEICNRYDLQCHPHSLKVKFAPKFSVEILMPITDQYEL